MGDRGSKYRFNWVTIGPPAKRHWNGVSLAGRWCLNIECWLGGFVIFMGSRPVLQSNPIFFVIFQGGGGSEPPPSLPLDPPMILMMRKLVRAFAVPVCYKRDFLRLHTKEEIRRQEIRNRSIWFWFILDTSHINRGCIIFCFPVNYPASIQSRATIGPPAKRHSNGISLACW